MSNPFTDLLNTVNTAQNALNNNTPLNQSQQESFKSDGFLLPATFQIEIKMDYHTLMFPVISLDNSIEILLLGSSLNLEP